MTKAMTKVLEKREKESETFYRKYLCKEFFEFEFISFYLKSRDSFYDKKEGKFLNLTSLCYLKMSNFIDNFSTLHSKIFWIQ